MTRTDGDNDKSKSQDSKDIKVKSAFVICPIGKDGSASRVNSDRLLKYVIRNVMEALGYTVDRADQISEPGIITNQIVDKIINCDVLIADLSEGNPNVFYELAIRHGLKKPFIHMINANEKIPFDNAQVRTIQFDLTDLDSVDSAKTELEKQVKAIESGKSNAESPISVAFDLESLKGSGNSDQNMIAALFEEVSSMRNDMRDIRRSENRTRHSGIIKSKADVDFIVNSSGDEALINLYKRSKITSIDASRISLTSSLSFEEDTELELRLTKLLENATRRPWVVSILPF